ncbi:MAG: alpha-amylase [Armatimonadota bacterium]|nr:MAG: alpha-amylase [Armatimonadota bacterium]
MNGTELPARRERDRFSALVPLKEGKNHIVAYCREGDRGQCRSNVITLTQRLKSRPAARIRASIDAKRITLDGGDSSPSEATAAPIVKYLWRPRKGNPARLTIHRPPNPGTAHRVVLTPPDVDGEYYVSLKVADADGSADKATTYFVVEDGRPRLIEWETENPAWVDSAVVYGVVPHNFGRHGFRSVIERLDSLQDLGISAIWLSPSNATPSRGHGYAVTDYFKLRRDYGTKADFRRLVKEAHARGIRVLMDFVPNHSYLHHRYMTHAQKHGKASPYYHFYDRDESTGDPTHYFHWRYLPNLNYHNPEVRRWMLEAFSYWVREFDVDGFRVDSAWGVKLRRPDFWRHWRRELKRIKPDLLLLAEAGARDPFWFTNGFDAAYDWGDGLGKWSMERVFTGRDRIVPRLHSALTNQGRGFHRDALVFRFLNNNDTGPRFITRHGLGMEMVAAAMLLTLPGLPCIYTGQEVGAEFEPYRTLGPISWEDRNGLRDYYKKLISLRTKTPSLRSRHWEPLSVNSPHQVYAYARYAAPQDPALLVVLNFSPESANPELTLTERSQSFAPPTTLTDLLRDGQVHTALADKSVIRLSLPGLSARILGQSKP